jgi:hypothetical protein
MKILYCKACKSLVRLRSEKVRWCECGKVYGQYREDRGHADVSDNPDTISLVISSKGARSLKHAIRRMLQRTKDKPESTRKDYQNVSSLFAYVRPNYGKGNPRSHKIKGKLKKKIEDLIRERVKAKMPPFKIESDKRIVSVPR